MMGAAYSASIFMALSGEWRGMYFMLARDEEKKRVYILRFDLHRDENEMEREKEKKKLLATFSV
jgi:hypothetical protein